MSVCVSAAGHQLRSVHRALADHVRALHSQSLFDRFNEPAPQLINTSDHHHFPHISHSVSSLASSSGGRRVHNIPIRVEGRTSSRPASCPPTVSTMATTRPQQQQQGPARRVFEIPVNVVTSSTDNNKPAITQSDDRPLVKMNTQPLSPSPQPQSVYDSNAERKLATLMSRLETEMSSSATVGAGVVKSPPPYHGPHITPASHIGQQAMMCQRPAADDTGAPALTSTAGTGSSGTAASIGLNDATTNTMMILK